MLIRKINAAVYKCTNLQNGLWNTKGVERKRVTRKNVPNLFKIVNKQGK